MYEPLTIELLKANNAARRDLTEHILGSSDDDEDQIVFRGHPSRRSVREMQWQIRRNTAPGRSSQPISAPSALAAQKSDNFQKFYRAVVSPTHVRVTAGGRIVPNTRAPPQPVFSWMQHNRQSSLDHDVVTWTQGVRLNPLHASPASSNPAAVQQPFTTTETFAHLSNQPLKSENDESLPVDKNSSEKHSSGKSTGDANTANETSAHNVKISPPQQFDVSKPFMYNGQLVCPVPAGFQLPPNAPMLPISMLGNPGIPPGPFAPPPGMFFQPPYSMPMPMPMHLMGQQQPLTAGGEHLQPQMFMPSTFTQQPYTPHAGVHGIMHPAPQPLINITNAVPVPPLPSISNAHVNHPPTATKAQLHVLRQHLKYFENQLANNRHQIDERHMNIQKGYISKQIDTLQTRLNSQLIQFGSDPRGFRISSGTGAYDYTAASTRATSTRRDTRQDVQVKHDMLSPATSQRFAVTLPSPHSSNGQGGPRSEVAKTVMDEPQVQTPLSKSSPNAQPSSQMDSNSRARLIAAAAKAPPFQPRALNIHPVVHMKQESTQPDPGYDINELTNPEETNEEVEARLLAKAGYWGRPTHNANPVLLRGPPLPASMPRARSMHECSARNHDYGPPSFTKYSTFNISGGNNVSSERVSARKTELGVPYLLGYPAQRSDPLVSMRFGQQEELVYNRELTPDEMRARYLYWGQAPRDLQKGLPKYDGRDFYPPSPVKTSASHEAQLFSSIRGDGASPHNFDPSRLFVEPRATSSTPSKPASTRSSNPNQLADPFQGKQESSDVATPDRDPPTDAAIGEDAASVDSWGLPVEHLSDAVAQFVPPADILDLGGRRPKFTKPAESPNAHQAQESWMSAKESARMHMNSPSQNTFLQDMLKNARFAPTTFSSGVSRSSLRQDGWLGQEYGMNDESPRKAFAERAAQLASQSDVTSASMRKSAPQYRGSAAPSLAPSTVSAMASFGSQGPRKNPFAETAFGYAPHVDARPSSVASIHTENTAPARGRYSTDTRPTPMTTASDYLRRITRVEQTPTPENSSAKAGIGPVRGSDW